MKKAVLGLWVLAVGCAAPPLSEQPLVGPPPRTLAVSAALGDAAAGVWRDAQGPRGAAHRFEQLQASAAAAKALADAGEHAKASAAYEEVYRVTPRSKLAEDSLYSAAEEAFLAGQNFRALEMFEKVLTLYPASEHYPVILERQFQIGKLFVEEKAQKPSWVLGFEKKDSGYGIEILERFVKQRDQHPLAPEALFLIGEAHSRADEPELAIESWQRLVKEYPRSSWARLGEYRIALAFVSLSYGADYDKRPLLTGLKRLRNYCKNHPTGDNIEEATAKKKAIEEELAQHELAIAKRYAREDRYRAAQIYLAYVRREYPQTSAAAEAGQLASTWEDPPDPPARNDEAVGAPK